MDRPRTQPYRRPCHFRSLLSDGIPIWHFARSTNFNLDQGSPLIAPTHFRFNCQTAKLHRPRSLRRRVRLHSSSSLTQGEGAERRKALTSSTLGGVGRPRARGTLASRRSTAAFCVLGTVLPGP